MQEHYKQPRHVVLTAELERLKAWGEALGEETILELSIKDLNEIRTTLFTVIAEYDFISFCTYIDVIDHPHSHCYHCSSGLADGYSQDGVRFNKMLYDVQYLVQLFCLNGNSFNEAVAARFRTRTAIDIF